MMDDTAQPETAAETDPFALGAEAFKAALGQAPERPRDDKGRFAPSAPEEAAEEDEEIEAEAGGEPEAEVESQDVEEEGEEAAEEAQPDVDLPTSWPSEKAELWNTLPPEAKAVIAEREGQRDAAVNAKFQEAANLRKANEAEINEAKANRSNYAEALEFVLSTVQPQRPPISMLDTNSSDYDPDAYHLRNAQYDQQVSFLNDLAGQRKAISAQEQAEAEREALNKATELNRATGPAFISQFPEAADTEKAQGFFNGLVEYAMKAGAPAEFFQNGPMTAIEWHIIAKARAYDEMQSAKAKVKSDPKPAPKKAAPPVRPGVTTPTSAIKRTQQQAARDRLARDGSVEAGAAVWKQFLS